MRCVTVAAVAAIVVGTAACASSIRPSYSPFPNARVDTVNAEPGAVIQELAARVQAESMRLNWTSPEEGFLETQWFNLVTRVSGQTDRNNPDRIILIRFWADPIGPGRTKLTTETVFRRTTDPSVLPRDREGLVPSGHGGERLAMRVLDAMYERFGR